MATGLMIVVIGSYVYEHKNFLKMDKSIGVEMNLVRTVILAMKKVIRLTFQLPSYQSRPCWTSYRVLSAKACNWPAAGYWKCKRPAYMILARAGKDVVIEPRKITIHDINPLIGLSERRVYCSC